MFDKNPKKPSPAPAASTPISRADLPAWVYAKPEPLAHAAEPQAPAVTTDDLLTRAEVARYLRVSDRTVSRLIRKGQLPALRIGRAVRIRHADLLNMLNGKPCISAVLGTCRE
ncbi:MAG: helix-turn-helix domain-containing protein [Sphingorhabdus sp.]|jgi:excisionase family DNA binding protein|uniref:helix-turn-helix domain-containing protein n=1 Tax=Sphingorhabdus sp. TaxID=1902408 RepID=UPI00273FF26D|nr:helix-turn-helix domain-containing protein [Sphingorhabdus sp.]MDP4872126.1 helix-turn-helix domain-containing protein [Sphingorhabdus sp.]